MSTTTTNTTTSRITKRKLDDAISILDSAVQEKAFVDGLSPSHDNGVPPSAKRRALGVKSIYATLSKYGFKTKDSPPNGKAASLRTPRLTALLDKSKSTGHSTHSSKPTHPPISSPQALVSRPPYRPTSTADFLARLGTFKLTTYRDKPRVIDAVVAARCGWKNDGVDRLVCDYCLATWIVASTTDMSREAAHTLTERHRAAMISSHKDSCPWRTRQCDESIYRVPIKGSTVMAREIRDTAITLTPLVNGIILKHPLTNAQAAHLESTIASVPSALAEQHGGSESNRHLKPSETALILSLFGWELLPPSATPKTSGILPQSFARAATVSNHMRTGSGGSQVPYRTPSASLGKGKARHSLDGTGPGGHTLSSASNPLHVTFPWVQSSDDADTIITCTMCQRRVGTWAFRTHQLRSTSGSSSSTLGDSGTGNISGRATPASPTSGGVKLQDERARILASQARRPRPFSHDGATPQHRVLDVVREHRSYCPYIVRSTPLPGFSFSLPAQGGVSASRPVGSPAANMHPLQRAMSLPNSRGQSRTGTPPTSNTPTTSVPPQEEVLTEGWRAVLSVVGRAGMGRRRRKRSDQLGMELQMASAAVQEESSTNVASGEGTEIDESERRVDEMVESVKRGGGVELLRYVRGLLG